MKTEEEIKKKLRELDRKAADDRIVGMKDALRWTLEEGPGYDGYDHK